MASSVQRSEGTNNYFTVLYFLHVLCCTCDSLLELSALLPFLFYHPFQIHKNVRVIYKCYMFNYFPVIRSVFNRFCSWARRVERSTDQVVRAVYRDSLGAWATNASLPGSSKLPLGGPAAGPNPAKRRELLYSNEALTLAPMLAKFGYDRVFPGLAPGGLVPDEIPAMRPEQRPDYALLESPLLQRVSN